MRYRCATSNYRASVLDHNRSTIVRADRDIDLRACSDCDESRERPWPRRPASGFALGLIANLLQLRMHIYAIAIASSGDPSVKSRADPESKAERRVFQTKDATMLSAVYACVR